MADELRNGEPLGFVDGAVAQAQEVRERAQAMVKGASSDEIKALAMMVYELADSIGHLGNMFKE